MLKSILLVLLIAIGIRAAHAQSTPDSVTSRKSVLSISPLAVLGHVSIFYERAFSKRGAVVGGIGFGSEKYPRQENSVELPSGQFQYRRITLEGRHYFGKQSRAPLGFFTGGYGRFARLTMDDYTLAKGQYVRTQTGELVRVKRQIYVTTIGGMVGAQLAIRRITLETLVGLHVQIPSNSTPFTPSFAEALSTGGVAARLGVTVGYLF